MGAKVKKTNRTRPDLAERNRQNATHGRSNAVGGGAYTIWNGLKYRCFNSGGKNYHNYGGRGITVCERWLASFENFLEDMGEKPLHKTLDRIDVNGNYEKDNCRWASNEEQSNNRRNNRVISLNGKAQTIALWAKELGFSRQAIRHRIESNWTDEAILTRPANHANCWINKENLYKEAAA